MFVFCEIMFFSCPRRIFFDVIKNEMTEKIGFRYFDDLSNNVHLFLGG